MSLPKRHVYALSAYSLLLLGLLVAIAPTTPGPQLNSFSPVVGGLIAAVTVVHLIATAYFIARAEPPAGFGHL